MPLHVYAPASPPCRLCGDGFEHRATTGEPPLATCPTCGDPVVRRPTQPVNSSKLSARSTVSRATEAGFAVLRRTSDGHYDERQ